MIIKNGNNDKNDNDNKENKAIDKNIKKISL